MYRFFSTFIAITTLPMVFSQTCSQYGQPASSGDTCLCPPGFNPPSGSNDTCALPVCGGSLWNPGAAAPGGVSGLGNITAGSCGCSDGWTGPGCTVCRSASACSSSLSRYLNSTTSSSAALNNTLTCSNAPTTYSTSQMSCDVVTPILQSLFSLPSTLTITRSLNASLTPGGISASTSAGLLSDDGKVWAQLWYNGVEQFYCQADGCDQAINSGSGGVNGSIWTCPSVNCTCRPGTEYCTEGRLRLIDTINSIVGPLTIDCIPGGNCTFITPIIATVFGNVGLQLSSCSIGECVEQYVIDQALGIIAAVNGGGDGLSGGVIAGLVVVGVILLAVIGLIAWGFLARRRARREMIADGEIPKGGGVSVKWSALGYEVRSGRNPWENVLVWLKGAGGTKSPGSHSTEGGEIVGPGGGKVVLRESYGELPVGGFCCILGPSGAGKSTLVDVLAGKRKGGKIEGNVGFTRNSGQGRVRIGYVDQSDVLSPTSTVLETLVFAASLRLPETVPSSLKIARANQVLEQLRLEHVANTRIGSTEHRGISGGESRRVSIGIELVAAPDVLVLDEPTSGLDSVSASRLITLLKTLAAESGTTIIASIHQPSSALYRAFDQVILLADGRQLYFGPGGDKPAEYFAKQGRPCPTGYNVADHLLEIASGPIDGLTAGREAYLSASSSSSGGSPANHSGESSEENVLGRRYTADQSDTPFAEKDLSGATYPPQTLAKNAGVGDGRLVEVDQASSHVEKGWWPRSHCATTFLTQIEVLSGREWRNLKRDKTLFVAHVFLACLLGVFAGGLYYKVSLTIAGFQNRVGSLFFLGSLIAFSSLSALYNLVEVRGLFLRERAGSFYSPQAWLLSRVLFDVIPLRLIPIILVGVIVYWMVGLAPHADRFFKFLLILVEYSMGMTLFNFLLACVFRHGGIAILLSSLCNLFLMTYAGFFVNIGQIPPVLRWLRYFSTLGYTLEALSINEVAAGLQIIDTLQGVPIQINAVTIMETLFGFGLGHYYRNVLILFAYIAGFGLLLVGAVVFLLRERR